MLAIESWALIWFCLQFLLFAVQARMQQSNLERAKVWMHQKVLSNDYLARKQDRRSPMTRSSPTIDQPQWLTMTQ
jgi:hypothetical protein